MHRALLILVSIFCFLTACNKSLNNNLNNGPIYNIDFKLMAHNDYSIKQIQSIDFGNGLTSSENTFLIKVAEPNNIIVSVIDSKVDIENPEIEKQVESLIKDFGLSTKTWAAYFKTEDFKEIKENKLIGRNDSTNIKTFGAVMTWNRQLKFPNQKMAIGDSVVVNEMNKRATRSNRTVYSLDTVANNIAYFNFKTETKYLREDEKMAIEARGNSIEHGQLEYDLVNNFFQYFESKESSSFDINNKLGEGINRSDGHENFKIASNTIVKISLVK